MRVTNVTNADQRPQSQPQLRYAIQEPCSFCVICFSGEFEVHLRVRRHTQRGSRRQTYQSIPAQYYTSIGSASASQINDHCRGDSHLLDLKPHRTYRTYRKQHTTLANSACDHRSTIYIAYSPRFPHHLTRLPLANVIPNHI